MIDDRYRLILIEDDAVLAEITAFRLELLGFQVETVRECQKAFDAVVRQQSHVIILDLAIADMNGYDLVERLSCDPATSGIPILVFSTSPDLSAVERAYEKGAADFLVTPYDPATLEQKLESLLDSAESLHRPNGRYALEESVN